MAVDPKITYTKGKIILDVYNLDPCTVSDIVPHVAIFHTSEWIDISSQDFKLSRISSSTVWSECTFVRMQYYVYVTEPGPHIWALKTREFGKSWLRVNGVVVATNEEGITGTAILKPGWYLIDIRMNKNDQYKYRPVYTYEVLLKRPRDREMLALSKDDIYQLQMPAPKGGETNAGGTTATTTKK